jgi:N,N-dimethylformamidase beta subunit-like, C-terminal
MRVQLSRGNVLFFGFIGVALLAVIASQIWWPAPHSQVPAASSNNVIVNENYHIGTTSWQIPVTQGATTQIQAYASASSVTPGQQLTFYVSTQLEGTSYSIDFYRLGWYGGLGGRFMGERANQTGHAQGYYDQSAGRLVNCHSCLVDTRTGLVEAHWQPSYTLTVPSDWTTGVYLAKFTDANHLQTYTPFDVLGNAHSTYVVVTADTTAEAYNNWGGNSLYGYNSNSAETDGLGRGVKVSFDRPYDQGFGSGYVLLFEANTIHWLEREGYDLSYISSVDLHEDSAQLLQHRAYLSIGHDEYWTKEMRDGVENARDHGVGLAFLEANAAYWQMRFEPDSAGVPNRTIVCYKVDTSNHDLARDPLYGKDNTRVTALWRDPVLNRPENALVGIMFSNLNQRSGFSWQVSSQVKSPLLDGTGLQPGQEYGCGLVGYEWDRVFANGATPAGLHVLSVSHTVYGNNHPDVSNTTYYIAPSGAMVFATGSIYWARSLDSYRLYPDKMCAGQNTVIPGMQELMTHVMDALVINPPRSS